MYIGGIIIVVFGLAFLLRNLGVLSFNASFWSVFYPLVIIIGGFIIIGITYEGRRLLKKIRNLFSDKEE